MQVESIKLDIRENGVAVVTIDNPPVNAHSLQVLSELSYVFDTLSDNDKVRVAILTGQGKVFCAGADIKARAGRTPSDGDHWQNSRIAREGYHSIMECQKPV